MYKIIARVKLIAFLMAVLLLCPAVLAQADGDYVFRKVKWGMSLEEVKASEEQQKDSQLIKGDSYELKYRMKIYGSEAQVTYFDLNKGLELVTVDVIPPALGANDLEGTMEAFKRVLNKKHGKIDWGDKIVLPHTWLTSETCIWLMIFNKGSGQEGEIIQLLYQPKEKCSLKPNEPIS